MSHVFNASRVCDNCGVSAADIMNTEHWIFESGYCDPMYCPRCKAEVCIPTAPKSIQSNKYISLDLDEWQ
jgi:hypothetical protein